MPWSKRKPVADRGSGGVGIGKKNDGPRIMGRGAADRKMAAAAAVTTPPDH